MPFLLYLAILLQLSGCCPHNYEPHDNPLPPEPFEVPEEVHVALVLGSGGVKGMAHVGVLEELEKAGIKFDLVVGCSAGSLVGALYCAHPCIANLKESVSRMRTSNVLDINFWTCRYGLSQGAYMERILKRDLSCKNFNELQIPLVIVATDILSGELVPIGTGDLITAIRASCCIPFVFAPVIYHDRVLVDGGVISPVPVCVAKDLGADVIIAVDLCELLPKTFPSNLFGVAKRSAEIAFLWQNSACLKTCTIVIKPKMGNVGMFDDRMKEELYQAGREACLECLPRIKEILAQKNHCRHNSKKRLVSLPCYKP